MTDCLRAGCGHPASAHASGSGHCRWCSGAYPFQPRTCSWLIAPAVAPRQWDEVAEYHEVHLMTEPDERCHQCNPLCDRGTSCGDAAHPDHGLTACPSCLCGWTGTLD